MTRETKVGIVVTASFVTLVGGVLLVKYVQNPPPATTVPQDNAKQAASATPADRNGKPATPSAPQQPDRLRENGGLPPLPGSFNEAFPPLPPVPSANNSNIPPPAPPPSQISQPGDDEQQIVRSSSRNRAEPSQRSNSGQLPEMTPLPSVIPVRADEPTPASPPNEAKPMPMPLAPLDLPGLDLPKPKNNDSKPLPPPAPILDLPGSEKKDVPKPLNPNKGDNSGAIVLPPPAPVVSEPPAMPKIDPKLDGAPLAPLPGTSGTSGANGPPPLDLKPIDIPPPPKSNNAPKSDFPLPNSDPKIPPPPDIGPKQQDPVAPPPKPMDNAPSVTPVPKPMDNAPSITPVQEHVNDLPPLPPMPLPKSNNATLTPGSGNANNLPSQPNQLNAPSLQPPNANPPPRTIQPQIDSYDEEWYTAQAGESYEGLSQKFYSDRKYAQALQQYNYDRTGLDVIRAGSTVRVPPARVLERKHPAAVPGLQPAAAAAAANVKLPTRSAAMGLPQSVGDLGNSTRPAPDGGMEYTVSNSPKTLREVAKDTLGSSDKWNLIFRLNRWVNPDDAIPVGTKLRMPSDAVINP